MNPITIPVILDMYKKASERVNSSFYLSSKDIKELFKLLTLILIPLGLLFAVAFYVGLVWFILGIVVYAIILCWLAYKAI